MTPMQYIAIIIAIIIMVVGLIIFLNGLRNRKNLEQSQSVMRDKNGIPIIPRHERDLFDEVNLDDALAGETTIVPDRSHLRPIIDEGDNETYSSDDLYVGKAYSDDTNVIDTADPGVDDDTGDTTISSLKTAHGDNEVGSNYLKTRHHEQAVHSEHLSNHAAALTQDNEEDLFSTLASATENLMPVIDSAEVPTFSDNSPLLDQHLLAQADFDQNSPLNHAQENINITLIPKQNFQTITGKTVLALVEQYGLRYGAMNMFHRYENKDGTGILWFSMMGVTQEGVTPFDLNSLPTSEYKGLVLFLSLPHPKALQGFDSMMSIVGLIAKQLDTYVLDEDNEALTRERKQQLRAQVQEY